MYNSFPAPTPSQSRQTGKFCVPWYPILNSEYTLSFLAHYAPYTKVSNVPWLHTTDATEYYSDTLYANNTRSIWKYTVQLSILSQLYADTNTVQLYKVSRRLSRNYSYPYQSPKSIAHILLVFFFAWIENITLQKTSFILQVE